MASKFLFFPVLLVLALHVSNLSAAQPGGPTVIDIVNKADSKISVTIKASEIVKGSAELSPNQNYQVNVDVKDVYFASAIFGLKFTSFRAYEPGRDKGQAAIYWRADNEVFSISYDNKNYKKVAPWESE